MLRRRESEAKQTLSGATPIVINTATNEALQKEYQSGETEAMSTLGTQAAALKTVTHALARQVGPMGCRPLP